jgi:hypothetical protein
MYVILPYVIFSVTVVVTGAHSPHDAEAAPDPNQPRYNHAPATSCQHLAPLTFLSRYTTCLPSLTRDASLHFPQSIASGGSKSAHNRQQAGIPRHSSDLPAARLIPRFDVIVSLHLHAISLLFLLQPAASMSFCSCLPSPKAICHQR